MKNRTPYPIALLISLFLNAGNSQDTIFLPSSDCENFNSFRSDPDLFSNIHLISPFENGTLYTDMITEDYLDAIIENLISDQDISFEYEYSNDEFQDPIYYYSRFQQFYKGIRVEGGGYTAAYIRNNTGDPGNPCDVLHSIAPRIMSGIDINTTPGISIESAIASLNIENTYQSELIITHNLRNQCEYRLVWRISYNQQENKRAYVDAHSGTILLISNMDENLMAPTINYNQVLLNDFTSGITTILKSNDERIKILDFDNTSTNPYSAADANYLNWVYKPSPITTAGFWDNEATTLSYQALYVADRVLPQFDNLGIGSGFNDLRIGTISTWLNNAVAKNWPGGSPFQCILLGGNTAKPNEISHELTHIFLRQFLRSDKLQAHSLHEGLSDIFGVYVGSKSFSLDWNIFNRNLSHPGSGFDCFTSIANNTSEHLRGKPLGYWFYLISSGNANPFIPALGMDVAFQIILGALNLKRLTDNSDYKDLMQATLTYALEKYGRCSNEFLAVAQGWERICVPTGYANGNGIVLECSMAICQQGSPLICEESNQFVFCACGQYPSNAAFNWTIIGPKSTEFTSQLGMQGNSQIGGQCLSITQIPTYPYYPQYIKIRLHSPTLCNLGIKSCIVERTIKIEDCGHDDPFCDYPDNSFLISNPPSVGENDSMMFAKERTEDWHTVKIYDAFGRLISQTSEDLIKTENLRYSGILFLVYYDKLGGIRKTSTVYSNDGN